MFWLIVEHRFSYLCNSFFLCVRSFDWCSHWFFTRSILLFWRAGGYLKIMFVGGPNVRKDYHMDQGEEVQSLQFSKSGLLLGYRFKYRALSFKKQNNCAFFEEALKFGSQHFSAPIERKIFLKKLCENFVLIIV